MQEEKWWARGGLEPFFGALAYETSDLLPVRLDVVPDLLLRAKGHSQSVVEATLTWARRRKRMGRGRRRGAEGECGRKETRGRRATHSRINVRRTLNVGRIGAQQRNNRDQLRSPHQLLFHQQQKGTATHDRLDAVHGHPTLSSVLESVLICSWCMLRESSAVCARGGREGDERGSRCRRRRSCRLREVQGQLALGGRTNEETYCWGATSRSGTSSWEG